MDFKNLSCASLIVVLGLLFGTGGLSRAGMSQAEYSQARTVKVCAIYEGDSLKCGSGVFVTRDKVLTALHVVSDTLIDGDTTQAPVHPNFAILREDSQGFEPAIFISSSALYDVAILEVDGVSPSAILSNRFFRGETVWAVGNPAGRDFEVVKTVITGLDIVNGKEMVTVDSKKNLITHGFSGGGLFSATGLVGIIQLCNDSVNTCLAMPTREIQKYVKENINERKN